MRSGVRSRARARRPQFAASLLASLSALLTLYPPSALAVSPETASPPAADLPAPTAFRAQDRPGDSGHATLLTWKDPPGLPAKAMIQIRRTVPPAYEWTDIATAKPGVERYEDTRAKDGVVYRYEIRTVIPAGA